MIRDAVPADIVLLGPIERSGDAQFVAAGHPEFADGATISLESATLAVAEGRIIVAEAGSAPAGAVVGWAYIGRSGDEMCLGQISVRPDHQGAGIGAALLREVICRGAAAGEQTLVLTTQGDVAWNRPWYEHFGFEVVPEAEWTESMRADVVTQTAMGLDWTTRVHMRLTL
jgi:predicted N-acetyltransferase YhbS